VRITEELLGRVSQATTTKQAASITLLPPDCTASPLWELQNPRFTQFSLPVSSWTSILFVNVVPGYLFYGALQKFAKKKTLYLSVYM
jgi:hypothetical protein